MDNKKTGALIAWRRQELGLTQKELGERLHVSDRAVSKWERAAGFPDVSLLESLADALDLSVLELIRGERLAAEEQLSTETERSVRAALRELSEWLWLNLGRCRRVIIILMILLITGTAAITYLRFGPFRVFAMKEREVSAAEALEAVPYAIITTDDFILSQRLLNDPVISFGETNGVVIIDEETAAPYRELISIEGRRADSVSIEVFYNFIVVSYFQENRRCILEVFCDGSIRKTACAYKCVADEIKVEGVVVANENNKCFTISQTVWGPLSFLFC